MKASLAPASQRRCGNCLGAVSGQYCAHCGQRHKSARRHFRQLASDFFNDVLNLDTKLLNTLKPLLFKPGFLSTEYFADRRMRYVSPFKLYVILSIVAFFFIQQSVDVVIDNNIATDKAASTEKSKNNSQFNLMSFDDKPWNAKTNPISISWLPEAANDLLNSKLSKIDAAGKRQDWKALLNMALAATPQALLLMLPFFALLLKITYIFRKRLYMEHLIVALHNHAFLLLAISLLLIATALWNWLMPASTNTTGELLLGWLMAWVPIYYLLSLKHIYQQGWRKTLLKFCFIGLFYLPLIILVLAFTLIIGILLA